MRNYGDEFLKFFTNKPWDDCFAVAKLHGEFNVWYAKNIKTIKESGDSALANAAESVYNHNWCGCKNTKPVLDIVQTYRTTEVVVSSTTEAPEDVPTLVFEDEE